MYCTCLTKPFQNVEYELFHVFVSVCQTQLLTALVSRKNPTVSARARITLLKLQPVHMMTMLLLLYLVTLQHVIAGPLPSFRPLTRQALALHSTASASDIFASPTIVSRTLHYSGENLRCSQPTDPLLTRQRF